MKAEHRSDKKTTVKTKTPRVRPVVNLKISPITTQEKTIRRGAEQAVKKCMGVKPEDRVFIITDGSVLRVGQAIKDAVSEITPNVKLVTLERYGKRPFLAMPKKLEADLRAFEPTVTFYAASGQEGEIRFRLPLLKEVLPSLKVRHAHMIDVTEEIMKDGMCADYSKVHEMSDKVEGLVQKARVIEVTTLAGTNLTAEFNPDDPGLKWVNSKGEYHNPGTWGNLPDGEVFTCPVKVNGTMVVDGVLGDYFSEKYGLLNEKPITIDIRESRVATIRGNEEIVADLERYVWQGENSDRVGEFAIGTNVGLTKLIGNLLQDEKYPGIHIAFGDPSGHKTGATWSAKSHIDGVLLNCTIKVNGKTIMQDGKFVI